MHVDHMLQIPQAFAAFVGTNDPEPIIHSRWSETCDLLVAHVRQIVEMANFDIQKLLNELDALAVKAGVYTEDDAPGLLGLWLGLLDTAQHKPFIATQFNPEDQQKLYVPFGYWLYRSEKTPEKTMIAGWGEAADILLSAIRLRAQAASKVHQGFEDLVTWLDDLALSKGAETVNPATAEVVRKSFGFDAFDMREALAIAA